MTAQKLNTAQIFSSQNFNRQASDIFIKADMCLVSLVINKGRLKWFECVQCKDVCVCLCICAIPACLIHLGCCYRSFLVSLLDPLQNVVKTADSN